MAATGRRTRVTRQIAADPASTALLVSGAGVVDLWPGVRRVGAAGGRTLVETLRAPVRAFTVRTSPPLRTARSHVLRLEWSGPGLATVVAVLRIGHVPTATGVAVTSVALVLSLADAAAGQEPDAGLRAMAEGFLDNLRHAAERRSLAA